MLKFYVFKDCIFLDSEFTPSLIQYNNVKVFWRPVSYFPQSQSNYTGWFTKAEAAEKASHRSASVGAAEPPVMHYQHRRRVATKVQLRRKYFIYMIVFIYISKLFNILIKSCKKPSIVIVKRYANIIKKIRQTTESSALISYYRQYS